MNAVTATTVEVIGLVAQDRRVQSNARHAIILVPVRSSHVPIEDVVLDEGIARSGIGNFQPGVRILINHRILQRKGDRPVPKVDAVIKDNIFYGDMTGTNRHQDYGVTSV